MNPQLALYSHSLKHGWQSTQWWEWHAGWNTHSVSKPAQQGTGVAVRHNSWTRHKQLSCHFTQVSLHCTTSLSTDRNLVIITDPCIAVFVIRTRSVIGHCLTVYIYIPLLIGTRTAIVDPLTGTLNPQNNGPLYRNTVIDTLAVDGWAVTFGTARMGLGGSGAAPVPSSLYQM